MPTLVLVSQFARFTPKMRTISFTVKSVTTCPNVVSITKFVIVEKYGVPTSSDLYTRFGIFT